MTDPITGELGSLILSGWIAVAPDTGRDAAYLLLTTPDERAAVTMPLVAESLGFKPEPRSITPAYPESDARVELDGRFATLCTGFQRYERPVGAEWAQIAKTEFRVVLVVGYEPMGPDEGADAYTDRVVPAGHYVLGIIPAA